MRKIFSILLLFCYLPSTIGLVVSQHFCQGQLEKIGFYKQIKTCCCGPEENESLSVEIDNCCSNKTSYHKLNSDQQVSNALVTNINNKQSGDVPLFLINKKGNSTFLPTSLQKNKVTNFYRKRNKPIAVNQPPVYDFICCWKTDCIAIA